MKPEKNKKAACSKNSKVNHDSNSENFKQKTMDELKQLIDIAGVNAQTSTETCKLIDSSSEPQMKIKYSKCNPKSDIDEKNVPERLHPQQIITVGNSPNKPGPSALHAPKILKIRNPPNESGPKVIQPKKTVTFGYLPNEAVYEIQPSYLQEKMVAQLRRIEQSNKYHVIRDNGKMKFLYDNEISDETKEAIKDKEMQDKNVRSPTQNLLNITNVASLNENKLNVNKIGVVHHSNKEILAEADRSVHRRLSHVFPDELQQELDLVAKTAEITSKRQQEKIENSIHPMINAILKIMEHQEQDKNFVGPRLVDNFFPLKTEVPVEPIFQEPVTHKKEQNIIPAPPMYADRYNVWNDVIFERLETKDLPESRNKNVLDIDAGSIYLNIANHCDNCVSRGIRTQNIRNTRGRPMDICHRNMDNMTNQEILDLIT